MVKLELNKRKQHIIATIMIDRSEKRNAFTEQMWLQLHQICVRLKQDIKPHVAVIQASGEQAFCAGADISELHTMIGDSGRISAHNQLIQDAQMALQTLDCATLAMINGDCIGGGVGIALACDFRVAVTHATFAITPAKLGLLYSLNDTRRLIAHVGIARAKQLLLLSQKINAQQAVEWGMLNDVVSSKSLALIKQKYIDQLAKVSGHAISGIKQTIRHLYDQQSDELHLRELFSQAFDSDDFHQAASQFIQK
ncbi:enoyl-CoA hydratase/isomerase family protein [Thalassotalea maritima]|uniref:enoyl-CoA hydratase/isomerase family protein n=1 Tax=Thalassotalea maritima TaxID=3242416 RepID=UPI003529BC7A